MHILLEDYNRITARVSVELRTPAAAAVTFRTGSDTITPSTTVRDLDIFTDATSSTR